MTAPLPNIPRLLAPYNGLMLFHINDQLANTDGEGDAQAGRKAKAY
jgi:hypothetical protein